MRALLMLSLLALPGVALAQEKTEKSKPTEWRVVDGQSEKKLAELEARLQAVLKEIQALRSGKKVDIVEDKKAVVSPEGKVVPHKIESKDTDKKIVVGADKDAKGKLEFKVKPVDNLLQGRVVWAQEPAHTLAQYRSADDANTVHLTRVTYTLTADKAKAVEAFLKANATAKVLEMKVDGDKLIVTTTPDTQSTIGQVVGLVTGKPVSGPTRFRTMNELVKPVTPAVPATPKAPAKPPAPPKPPEKEKSDDSNPK